MNYGVSGQYLNIPLFLFAATTRFPTILQQANLTVISNEACQNNFTTINIGDGQMCVHDENKTICLVSKLLL